MWKRPAGACLISLAVLGAMLLFAPAVHALCPNDCELFWTAPTQYTDNTAIEPQDLPLSFVAEWDNVALPATTQTFVPVPKPYGHNVPHAARVKSITATGVEGPFSPPFSWTSPKGTPKNPIGGGVR